MPAAKDGGVNGDAKEAASLASSAGISAGAAAVGSGPAQKPSEQLSKLELADGKTSSVTGGAASVTSAVAAGQSTGQGEIKPLQLSTVQHFAVPTISSDAEATIVPSYQTQTASMLDQNNATRGLNAGTSGAAPRIGAIVSGVNGSKGGASDTTKGIAIGFAGAGAGAAGVTAATAATASDKAKDASKQVQDRAAAATNASKSPSFVLPQSDVVSNGADGSTTGIQSDAEKTFVGGMASAATADSGVNQTEIVQKQE